MQMIRSQLTSHAQHFYNSKMSSRLTDPVCEYKTSIVCIEDIYLLMFKVLFAGQDLPPYKYKGS
jgi:hypothetical protein